MIRGLVDLAVGLGLFLVTWVFVSRLKVVYGQGMGLFGDLDVGQLFSGWLNWAVGL